MQKPCVSHTRGAVVTSYLDSMQPSLIEDVFHLSKFTLRIFNYASQLCLLFFQLPKISTAVPQK